MLSSSDLFHLQSQIESYEARGSSELTRLMPMVSRIRPLRNRLIRLICRLEGGQIWSRSFRDFMHRYYGVDIGRYSYGDSLWPGEVPPGTKIHNFCSLASGIKIFRRNHSVTFVSLHPFFFNSRLGILDQDAISAVEDNPLLVMDDAWIGSDTIITPRCCRIGIGSVVGAGAVVINDVPDFAIVAGNPARIIRKRFSDAICEMLLDSAWWKYRLDQLVPVLPLFVEEVTPEKVQQLCEHLQSQFPA